MCSCFPVPFGLVQTTWLADDEVLWMTGHTKTLTNIWCVKQARVSPAARGRERGACSTWVPLRELSINPPIVCGWDAEDGRTRG